jgi:hypothetical protein
MIYFIQAENGGPVKIGRTKNSVAGRLMQLQTGHPYKLKIIWVFEENGIWNEASIHERFKHIRLEGEWFKPEEELFEFIGEELCNSRDVRLPNGRSLEITECYGDNNGYLIQTDIADIHVSDKLIVWPRRGMKDKVWVE